MLKKTREGYYGNKNFNLLQIKQTNNYDYSCVDSRFFGVQVSVEHQIGYDRCTNSKVTIPCLQTNNVIGAKLLSSYPTEEEAKRILTIGIWLSDLATRCTQRDFSSKNIVDRTSE